MKLTKLKLKNYRCFGEVEQTLHVDNITALVGANSAGKTAALSALNCLFSPYTVDRIIKRSDFHLPAKKKPEEVDYQSLSIEAVFIFDELENGINSDAVAGFFRYYVVSEPNGQLYLRIRLEATWERSGAIEGDIDAQTYFITCPECETNEESKKSSASRKLLNKIRFLYIPAVRDPSAQLKNVSGTMMYQLMRNIKWSDTKKDEISKVIKELNAQFLKENDISVIANEIKTQWSEYDSDTRYNQAILRFNNTDLDSALKKAEVVFTPTVTQKEYRIEDMGDGLRSLFYISLMDSVLAIERTFKSQREQDPSYVNTFPYLTIIAVEEPENHISPHIMGKLIERLCNIASNESSQLLLTSHSPSIIKRVKPEDIRFFRLDQETQTTRIKEILLPSKESEENKYKYIKEAITAYPEIYFAKLVVLGEGDSEEIILPRVIELDDKKIDNCGISVVPLGGRHVNHFWRLLNHLEIPFVTLLDLDCEREGGGWSRIHYVVKQLCLWQECSKNEILTLDDGTSITEAQFDGMTNWSLTTEKWQELKKWIAHLENYNVFFSNPLDIDFMMLEKFKATYISLLEDTEGPEVKTSLGVKKIIEIEGDPSKYPEYKEKVTDSVSRVLKGNGGDGYTYDEEQKRLMIWYNYFFLNRGKPTTHIAVLSRLDNEMLRAGAPNVLKRLATKVRCMLTEKGEKE